MTTLSMTSNIAIKTMLTSLEQSKMNIRALHQQRDFSAGLSICQTLCLQSKADAEVWFYRASNALQLGLYDEAKNSCQEALARDANSIDALTLMGNLLLRNGLPHEAVSWLERALTLDKTLLSARENICYALIDLGEMDQALRQLSELLRYNKDHIQALFLMGAVHGQLGEFDRAIEYGHKVLDLNPDHADTYFNLGQAYMQSNKSERAIAMYKEVVKRIPEHFNSWNSIGIALHELNRPKEAIPYYRKALELKPDFEPTQFMLASAGGDSAPDTAPAGYVKDLFDKYADKFDKQLVEVLQYRTPQLLNSLIRSLPEFEDSDSDKREKRERILDFGCGTGLMGPLISEFASELYGVDLSENMLKKAAERGIYDVLHLGDLPSFTEIAETCGTFRMIVAADVFPYIGSLEESLVHCHKLLSDHGIFAFSVESSENTNNFELRDTNRYAHSSKYICEEAGKHGFSQLRFDSVALRKNRGKAVMGYLYIFKKAPL